MAYVQQKVEPIKVGDRVEIASAGKFNGKVGEVLATRIGYSKTGRAQPEYKVGGYGWFPVVFYSPDPETIRQRAAIERAKRDKMADRMFNEFMEGKGTP